MTTAFQIEPQPLYQREKPVRCPEYLKFLRRFWCIGCGMTSGLEAMHIGAHGLGQKSSDMDALPGCRHCHQTGPKALHKLGPADFQAVHGLDFAALQGYYRHLWAVKGGPGA